MVSVTVIDFVTHFVTDFVTDFVTGFVTDIITEPLSLQVSPHSPLGYGPGASIRYTFVTEPVSLHASSDPKPSPGSGSGQYFGAAGFVTYFVTDFVTDLVTDFPYRLSYRLRYRAHLLTDFCNEM